MLLLTTVGVPEALVVVVVVPVATTLDVTSSPTTPSKCAARVPGLRFVTNMFAPLCGSHVLPPGLTCPQHWR